MKKITRRPTQFKGFTVGLDVHQQFIEYAVLDAKGNDAGGGKIKATEAELRKLWAAWRAKGAVQVVLEACGCFIWIYDLAVGELGRAQVHVAQPHRIKMITASMEKNDENDAWWLAYLQYEGRLPESFVAEGDLRELRTAGRELRYMTDTRSDFLRRLRSHLSQLGRKAPQGWHQSKVGRQKVRELLKEVPGVMGEALRHLYRRITGFTVEIQYWRKRQAELAGRFELVATIAAEMPGMKEVVTGLVYGELGDPRRFYNEKAYAKATGLTPGYRESGGKTVGRAITRAGSKHARWAFTRAVISCMRCRKEGAGLQVRQWVLRRSKHKPKRAVIVAAARKLAEGVWRLAAWGEVFDLRRAFPVAGGGVPEPPPTAQRKKQLKIKAAPAAH